MRRLLRFDQTEVRARGIRNDGSAKSRELALRRRKVSSCLTDRGFRGTTRIERILQGRVDVVEVLGRHDDFLKFWRTAARRRRGKHERSLVLGVEVRVSGAHFGLEGG